MTPSSACRPRFQRSRTLGRWVPRFLRAYGQARPKLLPEWAARRYPTGLRCGSRAGHRVAVDIDGTKAWALAEDQPALINETEIAGVRLLANLDPLNAGRDRELLVADPAVRTPIWTVFGGPRRCSSSGEVAGLWTAELRTATL